jgi:MoaD family protein
MKVKAQFFAQLRDIIGQPELEIDLPDGAIVSNLLVNLYDTYPNLQSHDKSILTGIDVDFVNRDHSLRDGDIVAVMPPVQGG